jgi:iron(III) transport system substrate-binding protein
MAIPSWRLWRSLIVLLCATVALTGAVGRVYGASVEEVALLNRPERQKTLEEGAQKEAKLLWYSTLIVNQALIPLKLGFEKKYPFVQVEYFRANSQKLVQRMIAEYQAKRFDVDIIDGTSSTMIRKVGLMQRFYSPYLQEYPASLKDPQGYYAVPNVYFMTLGYNTNLVPPNEVPKTMNELLDPKWKGKMIWSTSAGSGAPVFIGNTLMTMGEEKGKAYLQKLATQNIAKSTASNRAVLDMVIAGEYAIAINIFNYHAVISKNSGAPVNWQALEPVPGLVKSLGLAKNSPHPYAAMLMIDFLISKEGQKIFQQLGYLPAHPDVPAKTADLKPGGGRFTKVNYMSPETLFEKEDSWVKLFEQLFFK